MYYGGMRIDRPKLFVSPHNKGSSREVRGSKKNKEDGARPLKKNLPLEETRESQGVSKQGFHL